jgi:hypothetical protein
MKKLTDSKYTSDRKLRPSRRPVGRPNGSNNVRIVPVFREDIDVAKLGRAALRLVALQVKDAGCNHDTDRPSETNSPDKTNNPDKITNNDKEE